MAGEVIKCGKKSCGEDITNKTEVEFSDTLNEFYCDNDCAVDRFVEYMRCTQYEFEPLEMDAHEVVLKESKLFRKD